MTPPPVPHDLETHLEAERARKLRARFLWMCGIYGVLSVVSLVLMLVLTSEVRRQGVFTAHVVRTCFVAFGLAVYVACLVYALRRTVTPERISRVAFLMVAVLMLLTPPVERLAVWTEPSDAVVANAAAQSFAAGFQAGMEGARNNDPRRTSTTRRSSTAPARPPTTAPGPATSSPPPRTSSPSPATAPAGVTGSAGPVKVSFSYDFDETESDISFGRGFRPALTSLWTLGVSHFLACLFMPWTLREAAKLAVIAATAFAALLATDAALGGLNPLFALLLVAFLGSSFIPGSTWCWWRHSVFRKEFRLRFESRRYHEIRGELLSARRIHESALPPQLTTGPLRLTYAYRPMRDIGGDLLFHAPTSSIPTSPTPTSPASTSPAPADAPHLVALVDVTGHGIMAAITVNRLVGELERLLAESHEPDPARPGPDPARLLADLNAYAHLMLASHGLYLSALILRIDPASHTLTYTSGGHPTAYLLPTHLPPTAPASAQASITDLPSTAPLLGVLPPEDFDPAPVTLAFPQDTTLLATTDGVTETRDPAGNPLLTAGLRTLAREVAAEVPPELLPDALMRRVDAHRGPHEPDDDALLLAIRLPSRA